MNENLEKLNAICDKTLAQTLGIKIIEVLPGHIVATMPVGPHNCQPMGLLHGGASVALAETVASLGGWLLVSDQGNVVVGLEINANHMRSARAGLVTAVGDVLHQGRTTQVWEIKITSDEGKLICVSRCTLAVIKG